MTPNIQIVIFWYGLTLFFIIIFCNITFRLSPLYKTTTNTKESLDGSKMLDYVVLTEIFILHLFHSEQICITISRLKDFQNQVFDIVAVYVCECIPLCSFQFMVFKVFIYIVKIFLLHLFAHCMLTTEKRDFGSSI